MTETAAIVVSSIALALALLSLIGYIASAYRRWRNPFYSHFMKAQKNEWKHKGDEIETKAKAEALKQKSNISVYKQVLTKWKFDKKTGFENGSWAKPKKAQYKTKK